MKNRWWLLGLLLVGCRVESHTSVGDAEQPHRGDEKIALADVPEHVKQAALNAVPGLVLTEAEQEIENGVTIFSLAGTVAGKRHEVEVSADGKVGEIEADDDSAERGDQDDDGDDPDGGDEDEEPDEDD